MVLPRPRLIAGVVAGLLFIAASAWMVRRPQLGSQLSVVPGEVESVLAEVLNATRIDGLARATTLRLRRAGIDVVYYGTAAESALDSTLILIRRGDSTNAVIVRNALGAGKIVFETDPRLLLDVTVLLGFDAAPPEEVTP